MTIAVTILSEGYPKNNFFIFDTLVDVTEISNLEHQNLFSVQNLSFQPHLHEYYIRQSPK